MQTNATHSLLAVSALHADGYDGFTFGPTAAFAATMATNAELINLDAAAQLFTIMADGAAPELLEPGPGGAVTAKAQQFFQVRGIDT